jgi:hypothetical protein
MRDAGSSYIVIERFLVERLVIVRSVHVQYIQPYGPTSQIVIVIAVVGRVLLFQQWTGGRLRRCFGHGSSPYRGRCRVLHSHGRLDKNDLLNE